MSCELPLRAGPILTAVTPEAVTVQNVTVFDASISSLTLSESADVHAVVRRLESGHDPRLSVVVALLDVLEVDTPTRARLVGAL